MGESPKQNSFDIRLLTLPDRMHVIDNMDVKMRIPLPSMQLWEVEDGPLCHRGAVRRRKDFYGRKMARYGPMGNCVQWSSHVLSNV